MPDRTIRSMQSDRLRKLPPYLFVEIDRRKSEYVRSGRRVLDLGVGDPDLDAPESLRRRLAGELDTKGYNRYPPDAGLPLLKAAIRAWAAGKYGIEPGDDEILVTIGSKEAIAHLPLATVDPGETVLVPDPGYPVYNSSAVFAGAVVERMPLREACSFLPDLEALEGGGSGKPALMFLNYPNNPTSATAGADFFDRAMSYCRERGCILVNDAAYSGIVFEGDCQPLFPQARRGGAEYVEFFSFSKTFSITGWRIGFAIGSPAVISALARLKSNVDSGVFPAIQAAVAGLLAEEYDEVTGSIISVYRRRRDILSAGLGKAGFTHRPPRATFYFWLPVPQGGDSIGFCGRLLEETGIVATPGVGFGACGEGYFRLSLTAPTAIIEEAAERLGSFK